MSTVHRAFDTRIYHKMCRSLARADYDVHWVVQGGHNDRRDGVVFHSIPAFSNRALRMIFGTTIAFFRVLFLNPKVVHFHDPELIPCGLVFRMLGKRVVYDMHELTGRQLSDKAYLKGNLSWFEKGYNYMEKLAFRHLSAIVIAEDGYMPYLRERYPENLHKVTALRNFPLVEKIEAIQPGLKTNEGKTLVYAGGLTRIRGIYDLIRVLPQLPNTRLVLMGPWESDEFHQECQQLDGYSQVDYRGTVTFEEVIATLKVSDVGMAVLYPQDNYKTSRPVKVYEYMACNLPAVVSDFEEWKRWFGRKVWYANAERPETIVEAVKQVLSDPERASKIAAARKAVMDDWNWEIEQNRLLDLYNRLI